MQSVEEFFNKQVLKFLGTVILSDKTDADYIKVVNEFHSKLMMKVLIMMSFPAQ